MTKTTFRRRLRSFRRKHNLTQKRAAEILGEIPLDTYRNWEYENRGGSPASHTMRAVIAMIEKFEDKQ